MSQEIQIALFTGLVAFGSAALAVYAQFRLGTLNRELERLKLAADIEKTHAKYREPLAHAAADLQSRLFNILGKGFIPRFLVAGSTRESTYALFNTSFLFAQFFAWTEAVRLEIQFIKLDQDENAIALSLVQGKIYSIFQTDSYAPILRVFAGEQRAIGERMLVRDSNGLRCIGYGEFLQRNGLREDELLDCLYDDVKRLGSELDAAIPRLEALQGALVDLMEFLDPKGIRFPKETRTRWIDRTNQSKQATV